MSGAFKVSPADVSSAGSIVARECDALHGATAALNGTADAALGTPAAGACETLVSDAVAVMTTIVSAVEGLSQSLRAAGDNYARVEAANATGLTARWGHR